MKFESIIHFLELAPPAKGLQPRSSHFNSDAEKARALDSLTADLNVDLSGIPDGEENEDDNNIFDQKWIEDHGIVFADDMPEGAQQNAAARNANMPLQPNQKWAQQGDVLQCPECFK
jgi:hypothetical protein